jgi:hypothetical protein
MHGDTNIQFNNVYVKQHVCSWLEIYIVLHLSVDGIFKISKLQRKHFDVPFINSYILVEALMRDGILDLNLV